MAVNLSLLMGEQNIRKSSSVRSLTGIARRRKCDIKLVDDTIIDIFAMLQALQEANIDPDSFVKLVKKQNCSNVLVPLRIYAVKDCPDGIKYIERFMSEGWKINPIFILGTDKLPYTLHKKIVTKYIENSCKKTKQS